MPLTLSHQEIGRLSSLHFRTSVLSCISILVYLMEAMTKTRRIPASTTLLLSLVCSLALPGKSALGEELKRPLLRVRGIYGGIPYFSDEDRRPLKELGVNAIFLHSGSITAEKVKYVKSQGVQFFAEFNTLHVASYLNEHPDAAPVGSDGAVSPPPHDWQGICPTHSAYRKHRMDAFRDLLVRFPLDGIWLDYHHSHASWERATPEMPDTCFCDRCLSRFTEDTGIELPEGSTEEKAVLLLGARLKEWVQWRCDVFTSWVREFRAIIDAIRPNALLGTFHNPWNNSDYEGARLKKLAIDLKAQSQYVDVFSPMPYHARFGHAADPEWISRQVKWLGDYLGLTGQEGEPQQIWPIVQLSDWGEEVSPEQVVKVLEEGTAPPASGVIIFAWGSLRKQHEKLNQIWPFFREVR